MLTNNRPVIITDPCYIIKNEDGKRCNYGENLKALGFTDYISESTLYGDWSCTTYLTKNGEIDFGIGNFCADAGMVCVVFIDELLKYNPEFFSKHGTWCYTSVIYPPYRIEYEIIDDEAHIVGYDKEGKIRLKTMQTGA